MWTSGACVVCARGSTYMEYVDTEGLGTGVWRCGLFAVLRGVCKTSTHKVDVRTPTVCAASSTTSRVPLPAGGAVEGWDPLALPQGILYCAQVLNELPACSGPAAWEFLATHVAMEKHHKTKRDPNAGARGGSWDVAAAMWCLSHNPLIACNLSLRNCTQPAFRGKILSGNTRKLREGVEDVECRAL